MVLRALVAAFTALILVALPAEASPKGFWTRAWTSSLWQGNEREVVCIDNQTIRAQMRVGAGGSALRLRLANDFGTAPVRVGAATVRTSDGRLARVTFGGRPTTRIAIGAPSVSDPVALAVKPFELIEVSIHLPRETALVGVHADGGDQTLISSKGDFTEAATFSAATRTHLRPLLAGVDVLGARKRPVIVAVGDSITDNTGCANDSPIICLWSEVLGRRLLAAGKPHVVINQAISGNKIITPIAGPNALARFDRDVLAVPNVTHIVLLEGINDIGTSGDTRITAEELIEGYRQLALRAHDHGIKVIAMTVLPFEGAGYYAPEREIMRMQVNEWIRTGGAFDAVIDMERVMADPANPKRLRADLQTGDNLHPNAKGETVMGDAIPLSLFR